MTKKRVPSTPTPNRRRRSLLPIVAIATIVLPIIALGVVFFRWSSSIQNDLNFIRNAIAAANEPDSLEDLVASYSAVPDSENAARLYLGAFKEFGKIDITKERINTLVEVTDGLDHNAEYPPDHIRDLRSMIADAEPGLELLEQATQRPKSHYSIDLMLGTQTDLPHLKELDFAAQYLYQASELALLDGDTAAALRWQAALIPMGSSLVDEPTLLSQLVAIEIDGIALDALERLLNKARLDDAQLQRLDALYAAAIRPHTLRKIMIAERCMSVGEVRDFVDEMLEAGEDTDNKKYESPGFPFSLLSEYQQLGIYRAFEQIIPESNPDWPTLVEKLKNGIEMPDTLAVGLLMPGLYRSAVAFARDIAMIRIARTALAIERYRLANGDLPTSLADCVPAYLDSVPEDPFDGLPIRYRPTEDGYILYSVFDDLDDDDGAEWKRDREWVRSGDYPFEVRTAPSSLSP